MMKRLLLLPLLLLVCWISVYSENSILTGIRITAGSRGLALVLEADGPIIESVQNTLQGKTSVLAITLENMVYGLHEFSFSNFPANSPVKKIIASEEGDASVIIEMTLREKIYNEMKTKRSQNRTILLISSAPFGEFNWKVSKGRRTAKKTTVVKASPGRNEKRAVIESIRLLKRGEIEQLIITTDSPVRIKAKKKNGTIIAVFENAVNGLARNSYVLPNSSIFKTLTLKESMRKEIERVGIVINNVSASLQSSFIQIKPRHCVIYAIRKDSFHPRSVSLWTSDGRRNFLYEFSGSEHTDISDASYSSLHSKSKAQQMRFTVIRDMVNFRSAPSSDSPENIIGCLQRGTTGTYLRQKGQWYNMRLDGEGTEGWVYASLVDKSARGTKEQKRSGTASRTEKNAVESKANDVPVVTKAIEKKRVSDIVPGKSSSQVPQVAQKSDKEERTIYTIYGRDPFLPLNQCEFLQSELLNVESCKLVGILYHEKDRVALLEDNSKGGEPFALREKDAVKNGRVIKIRKNDVVFIISDAGFSRKFILKVNPKEE